MNKPEERFVLLDVSDVPKRRCPEYWIAQIIRADCEKRQDTGQGDSDRRQLASLKKKYEGEADDA